MGAETWRPVRPMRTFPRLNPRPFDPRENVFIPDAGVSDHQIRDLSIRKVHMLGTKIYNSATQSIPDITNTTMTFDTKTFDEGDLWRVSTPTKFVIPYDGIWSVSAFGSYAANATGVRRLSLLSNGTTILRYVTNNVGGATQTDVFLTSDFKLTAGDVLTVQAYQDSGVALDIKDGEDDNFFSCVFRGPI